MISIRLQRTNATDKDFRKLVNKLDQELAEADGEEHAFYHQYNAIENIDYVLVAYDGESPVGIGAIKPFDNSCMEVKRMYTIPEYRALGIASVILANLEIWAGELGYTHTILETGKRLPNAVALYGKNGYATIPNYGQYAGVENSVCFKKKLL